MSSEWKVTTNYVDGKKLYAVYRLRDTAEVDHSGNREFVTGYVADKQEAVAIADKLNQENMKGCEGIMKVLLFEVDKEPETREVENSLESMQALVDGYIEVVGLGEGLVLICNEEGKLENLEPVGGLLGPDGKCSDIIRGSSFICRADGEEFTGIQDGDEEIVKKYFRRI